MNPGTAVRETFSSDDRLRKRREFEECYVSGFRVSGRHLQLFLLARKGAAAPRIGISTGRRTGSAVTRNRLKRRLREIFRRNRAGLPPGVQVVVNVRSSAASTTFSEFAQDYLSTLERGLSRLKGGR